MSIGDCSTLCVQYIGHYKKRDFRACFSELEMIFEWLSKARAQSNLRKPRGIIRKTVVFSCLALAWPVRRERAISSGLKRVVVLDHTN